MKRSRMSVIITKTAYSLRHVVKKESTQLHVEVREF